MLLWRPLRPSHLLLLLMGNLCECRGRSDSGLIAINPGYQSRGRSAPCEACTRGAIQAGPTRLVVSAGEKSLLGEALRASPLRPRKIRHAAFENSRELFRSMKRWRAKYHPFQCGWILFNRRPRIWSTNLFTDRSRED